MAILDIRQILKKELEKDLGKAILLTKKHLGNNTEDENEITLLLSRFNQINKEFNQNIISRADKELSLDKIRVSLINCIDSIKFSQKQIRSIIHDTFEDVKVQKKAIVEILDNKKFEFIQIERDKDNPDIIIGFSKDTINYYNVNFNKGTFSFVSDRSYIKENNLYIKEGRSRILYRIILDKIEKVELDFHLHKTPNLREAITDKMFKLYIYTKGKNVQLSGQDDEKSSFKGESTLKPSLNSFNSTSNQHIAIMYLTDIDCGTNLIEAFEDIIAFSNLKDTLEDNTK